MPHSLSSTFVPLALLIVAGYLLGKKQAIDLKSVSALAIFVFTPIVGYGATAQLDISAGVFILPLVTFLLAVATGFFCLTLAKVFLKKKSDIYLLPMAAGSGNTGYLGLPLAISVLGEQAAGTYLMGMLGVTVFETTLGFYFVSRGKLDPREAFTRVLRLPLIYALGAGLATALIGIEMPQHFQNLWTFARGAYTCIGMMIIGLALARVEHFRFNIPVLGLGLAGKFILWPILALGVIMLDRLGPQVFNATEQKSIILLAVVPMAANLAAYAAHNDTAPEQAAGMILVSTVMALAALPWLLPILMAF